MILCNGIVYIAVFLIYLVIKNIQLKNYYNSFLITITTLLSYTIFLFLLINFILDFQIILVLQNLI